MKRLLQTLARKRRKSMEHPVTDKLHATEEISGDLGLQIVDEDEEPLIDIIAFHGHGGHWRKSWIFTQPAGTDIFWLKDFLPDILPPARIISYGYDASDALEQSMASVVHHAFSDIIKFRESTQTEQRPVIFTAHSFGGLIVKSILGLSYGVLPDPHGENLRTATYGVVYLGVPEDGKAMFGNLSYMNVEREDPLDTPLITALKNDVRFLREQEGRYNLIKDGFVIKHFLESDGASQVLADDFPAKAEDSIQLNKTHGMMIRFESKEDPDFKIVARCLLDMAEQSIQKST